MGNDEEAADDDEDEVEDDLDIIDVEATVSAEDAKWFEEAAQNASKLQTAAFEGITLRIALRGVCCRIDQGLPPSLVSFWQLLKEKEAERCGSMAKSEVLQAKADEQQRATDFAEQSQADTLASMQALAEAGQAAATAKEIQGEAIEFVNDSALDGNVD